MALVMNRMDTDIYVSPRFHRVVSLHVLKNLLKRVESQVPLLLGVHGPSGEGKTFQCEANESVLEAALRSGLNLSYHCATGSCGECRARIVEGQVKDYRYFDFVIPEAEKIANTVLLCSVTPNSDLVIEAHEAASAKDIPLQQLCTKVAKLERLNHNNLVLHLRTPRSNTLRFLAGQ